jgi:hypothetical protein
MDFSTLKEEWEIQRARLPRKSQAVSSKRKE